MIDLAVLFKFVVSKRSQRAANTIRILSKPFQNLQNQTPFQTGGSVAEDHWSGRQGHQT